MISIALHCSAVASPEFGAKRRNLSLGESKGLRVVGLVADKISVQYAKTCDKAMCVYARVKCDTVSSIL